MFYLISYDIPDDSIRTKIAKLCQAYGLQRIQYSVFAGEQTKNMIETLAIEANDYLKKRLGKIVIIPICARCLEKIIGLGMEEITSTMHSETLGIKEEEKVMIV